MSIQQIPGDCPIELVKGDDLILQFNIPFDITDYVWTSYVHLANEGDVHLSVAATPTTSVLGVLQIPFYASVTTTFANTSNGDTHSWVLKYVDDAGLVRSFISGVVEVL